MRSCQRFFILFARARSTGARTPEGKAICSKNVLVGNANRAKALELARQELKAAQAKIDKLTRGKKVSWFDKLMFDLASS